MWKAFNAEDNVYMFKIKNSSSLYKIYLTDIKDIWYNEFSEENIVQKFQECNPTMIIKIEEAVSEIWKLFMEIAKADVEINKVEDKIDINIKSKVGLGVSSFKIKYALTLSKADQNKFMEEITVPMVHTIKYLEQQQTKLCELIQKKDRELEEYKMEKGSISRADLTTEKFDLSILKNPIEKLMLNVYSNSNKFWETFVNKHGDVEIQLIDVKVEPWNDINRKRKIYNSKTAAKKKSQRYIL